MPIFEKLPIKVEAEQWFCNNTDVRVEVFTGFDRPEDDCEHCGRQEWEHGWIQTLEGGHIVCPGDWIITGIQGEAYPCKPDIFEKTYRKVE